jgi:hypothetical protein
MNTVRSPAMRPNPFATRHTRPGRVMPRDGTGRPLDVAALASRIRAPDAAAIEGPHGAGKSNLLAAIAGWLADAGALAGTVRARSGHDGSVVATAIVRARPGTILCVDGWESLGAVRAAVIRWMARRRGVGLIVTTHRPAGMPTLARCTTTSALLGRIVADLPDHGGLVTDADVEHAYAAHGGNLREALYDLYDRFERRARRC